MCTEHACGTKTIPVVHLVPENSVNSRLWMCRSGPVLDFFWISLIVHDIATLFFWFPNVVMIRFLQVVEVSISSIFGTSLVLYFVIILALYLTTVINTKIIPSSGK